MGSTLIIRKGNTQEEILSLIKQLDITAVYWNSCYDPDRLKSNQKMKMILEDKGIICKEFNSHLLLEPWIIKRRITLNIRCLRLLQCISKAGNT